MATRALSLAFAVALGLAASASGEGLSSWRHSYVSFDDYAGETRMEYCFSFKYRLFDLPAAPYFAFQSLYDFSYGTRYSNPVNTRQLNPGLFLDFEPLGLPLRVGYFHESNGQDLGAPWDDDGKARARADLAAKQAQLVLNGYPREWALDSVSRSWDYAHFSYLGQVGGQGPWRWSLEPELRLYTGKQFGVNPTEEALWWDHQAPPSYINQYDGLRLRAQLAWRYAGSTGWLQALGFQRAALGLDLRTGYSGLGERISTGLDLELRFGRLPFFAYYFAGYGPYISDYTGYHRSSGLGFRVPLGAGDR